MDVATAGTELFQSSDEANRKRKNCKEVECLMDITSVVNGKQKGGTTMENE